MKSPIALAILCVFLVAGAAAAAQPDASTSGDRPDAQHATGDSQGQQGGLVVEPIKSGLVVAPDVRVTRVNGFTRTLVGAYGGWQVDDRLLLGGGGYWLPDRAGDVDMAYGGGVVGCTMPLGRAARFGARALFGGGEATVTGSVAVPFPHPFDFDMGQLTALGLDGRFNNLPGDHMTGHARVHEGFAIAEPQADVIVHLNRLVALEGGVGYRLIGAANGFEKQLRGPVGSVSLRLGAGS